MELRATPLVRWWRALLLAAVVATAGSVAHASAGGLLPGAASMSTLYVVVAGACAALLGREVSALRLVTITVGGQLAVHGVLSALAGHADGAGAHAAHDPGALVALGAHADPGATALLRGAVVHGVEDLLEQPLMATLHVVAAAAVALWLAVGERALWALLRLARCGARTALERAAVALGLHPVVLRGVPRAVGVRAHEVAPRPLPPVWSRGPARRGPPPVLLPH